MLRDVLRDSNGAPEALYLADLSTLATDEGWMVTSLDVGSWRPLAVGDRVVALDRDSSAEFLVEVAAVEDLGGEVFYRVRHLADLDPAAEPGLDSARAWLPRG